MEDWQKHEATAKRTHDIARIVMWVCLFAAFFGGCGLTYSALVLLAPQAASFFLPVWASGTLLAGGSIAAFIAGIVAHFARSEYDGDYLRQSQAEAHRVLSQTE